MDPFEARSMDAAQATAAACMGWVGGTQCENLSATGVSWAAADDANPTAIAAITPSESIFISHPPEIVLRTSMVPLRPRCGCRRPNTLELTERAGSERPRHETCAISGPMPGSHSARCTGSRICEGWAAE